MLRLIARLPRWLAEPAVVRFVRPYPRPDVRLCEAAGCHDQRCQICKRALPEEHDVAWIGPIGYSVCGSFCAGSVHL